MKSDPIHIYIYIVDQSLSLLVFNNLASCLQSHISQDSKKMGPNFSTSPGRRSVLPSPRANNNVMVSIFSQMKRVAEPAFSPKTSGVVAFHSSVQWRAYFESSKQSKKLVVIDFTATWCGPCRYMEPIINEFAEKYTDVDFVKIDVDELRDVAREFGVEAMPTFLLLKQGREIDKVVGAKKEDLRSKIERHMIYS
ncbi:hypothetical protein Dimus_014983 [Dionaea muscipula]